MLAAALVLAALPGCRLARLGSRTVGAFVSGPREVAKATRPVDEGARLGVVWVGQSTALVQLDDKVVLTDPIFTSSAGQLWKRLVEPGLDPKDVPPVDVVLVSNVHFDHLSLGSLDAVEDRIQSLLSPRAGTAYLTDFSFPVHELGAWQTWEKDGLRVTAVPVEQVGGRYGADEAWMEHASTGYVVEYHGLTVYFAGDAAYDQRRFVETAERFPTIDLALLPIAPIEPRDVMRPLHMDPREALQAFVDLGAARMVPIHYDTFVTSTDEPGDALRVLTEAKKKVDLAARLVAPLAVGEHRVFIKVGEETPLPAPPVLPAPRPATPPSTIPDDDSFE